MTLTETLLILAHVADPTPYAGHGWQVDELLARRDDAQRAIATATTAREWWDAIWRLDSAEDQLALLLDAQRQPKPLPDVDDGWSDWTPSWTRPKTGASS